MMIWSVLKLQELKSDEKKKLEFEDTHLPYEALSSLSKQKD